jgi:endonuclease III-like uncharacterized protein
MKSEKTLLEKSLRKREPVEELENLQINGSWSEAKIDEASERELKEAIVVALFYGTSRGAVLAQSIASAVQAMQTIQQTKYDLFYSIERKENSLVLKAIIQTVKDKKQYRLFMNEIGITEEEFVNNLEDKFYNLNQHLQIQVFTAGCYTSQKFLENEAKVKTYRKSLSSNGSTKKKSE